MITLEVEDTKRNPDSKLRIKKGDYGGFLLQRVNFISGNLIWSCTGKFLTLPELINYLDPDPDIKKMILREFL